MKYIKDPAQIVTAKKEDLIELYEFTLHQIDELLAQKDVIKKEFEARIEAKQMPDSDEVAGYSVTRFPKIYTNKVTLEEAKKFGATVMKETINSPLLNKLVKSGTEISGAEIRYEVRIARLKQAEDTEDVK